MNPKKVPSILGHIKTPTDVEKLQRITVTFIHFFGTHINKRWGNITSTVVISTHLLVASLRRDRLISCSALIKKISVGTSFVCLALVPRLEPARRPEWPPQDSNSRPSLKVLEEALLVPSA